MKISDMRPLSYRRLEKVNKLGSTRRSRLDLREEEDKEKEERENKRRSQLEKWAKEDGKGERLDLKL